MLTACPSRSQELTPFAWLLAAEANSRSSGGVLSFTRFNDEICILNSPIYWKPNQGTSLPSVEAPTGFVTDLASVPRPFFSIFRPDGRYAHAAVIHDYLYWTQATSKDVADQIFYQDMTDTGISPIQKNALYLAVSTFGEQSWKNNAILKAGGERRIVKKFPNDPRQTWSEWKMRPDVF
jgi:hypothetical protein